MGDKMSAGEEASSGADRLPSGATLQPIAVPAMGSVDFVLILREEVDAICASEAFRRSPIIVKLLKFLVEETVAGRGERLKSYTVAVDGLGRPDDFDAATDSYPRVQVTRLRKLLEAYYAERDAVRGLCLLVPSGSYELRLAPRELAYPALTTRPTIAPDGAPAPSALLRRPEAPAARSRRLGWPILGAVIALAVVAGLWLGLGQPASTPSPRSPLVLAMPTVAEPAAQGAAQAVYGKLIDGMSRSWVARTVTKADSLSRGDPARVYRIESQIAPAEGGGRPGGQTLFVRLLDQDSSTVIWSKEYRLPTDGAAIDPVTDAMLADLGGSYGAIEAAEAQHLRRSFASGYACLTQYFRYMTTRNHAVRDQVRACLDQPAEESRLEGARQGIRAMFVLDTPPSSAGRAEQIRASTEQAQRAVEAFPADYYAQFALARLSYAQGDCPRGARHARLTMTANSNDPLVVGVLATLNSFCGLPDELGLADRLFRAQINGDASARLTMILVAIATNRRDRLEAIADLPVPETGENAAFVHLCNTLMFAALDDQAKARQSWESYRRELGANRPVGDLLGEFLVADLTRRHIESSLRARRVID
jgi:hypothetical protein